MKLLLHSTWLKVILGLAILFVPVMGILVYADHAYKATQHFAITLSPTPIQTVQQEVSLSPIPTTKLTRSKSTTTRSSQAVQAIPSPVRSSGENIQSLIQAGVNQYNSTVSDTGNQQNCTTQMQQIAQKYDPQIHQLQGQIDTLNQKEEEICPSRYAQACRGGSIASQLSDLDRQINSLEDQQNSLSQQKTNEQSVACGVVPQLVPITDYVQRSIPSTYTITSGGNGMYYVQGDGTSCTVTPSGSQYYVSCN